MMRTKLVRLLAIALISVFALSLTACGGPAPAKNRQLGSVTSQIKRGCHYDRGVYDPGAKGVRPAGYGAVSVASGCVLHTFNQASSPKARQVPSNISPRGPPGANPLALGNLPTAGFFQRGIDFAWSCPSPTDSYGGMGPISFGASYLSWDFSKNWTRGCVNWYHANGRATVAVWETTEARATEGYDAGKADAQKAAEQAAFLGEPANRPVFFAIDCDCSFGQVAGYFRGADDGIGVTRVGDYGGYYPTRDLMNAGLAHYGWQAYAWSGGQWSQAALEQWLNGDAWDYDRALAPDYGQWPYNSGPSPEQVHKWIAARGAALHAYYRGFHRGYGCHQPVLTSGFCGQQAWRVDHFQKLVDTAHGYYPHCFGPRRNLGAAECRIVRPAVAIWSRAATSSHRFHNYGVERYFNNRIAHTLGTSRL